MLLKKLLSPTLSLCHLEDAALVSPKTCFLVNKSKQKPSVLKDWALQVTAGDFPCRPEILLGIALVSQLRILGMCWRLHRETLIVLLDGTKWQPNHMFLMQHKMEEIVVKSFV